MISLAISLVVWGIMSWPLPTRLFEGIPSSSHNVEKGAVRTMIPGDHLQLLYHFWLAGDMAFGPTPVFYNLYEFNTGDDAARYRPKSYYVPFSLVYALLARLAGRAFGWNATGFLALWLTYLATWRLVRRYTRSEAAAAAFSLVSILLPIRWISLLGGSPAGYAMMWMPVALLGLDLAVRDDRIAGGLLAGIGVVGACWSDAQVFFYAVLAMPFWCAVALAARGDFGWARLRSWGRVAVAVLPAAILAALALVYRTTGARQVDTSLAGTGRSLREVALFSPHPSGLVAWHHAGVSSHIFVGGGLLVLLAVGCAAALMQWRSARNRSPIILLLLCAATLGIILLALGTRGPFDAALLRAARKLIPPYVAVRQPAKIFCLLPTFLSVAGAVTASLVLGAFKGRRWPAPALALLLAGAAFEMRSQVRATVCLLESRQGAYAAVAADSTAGGAVPRALVVPLWPGDSAWSSLDQYYASLYRIRLINGYSPIVPSDYVDEVFHRFDSANKGYLSDAQLDDLLRRGIRHVLLHEDAFPEKVSPLSVGFTLKQFTRNPRLELLAQDGPVWAFRILPSPVERAEHHPDWPSFSAARLWEAERSGPDDAGILDDPAASGGRFVRLDAKAPSVQTGSTRMQGVPGLRFLVRLRGHGAMKATVLFDDREVSSLHVGARSSRWFWADIPCEKLPGYGAISLRLDRLGGSLDADLAVLSDQPPKTLDVGKSWRWPAPCFFHAGYTDAKRGVVVLRTAREPDDAVFYGPRVPLGAGTYQAELRFSSPAAPGTLLGTCRMARPDPASGMPVVAGEPAVLPFEHPEDLPVRLDFVFARNGDIEISEVVFKRVK